MKEEDNQIEVNNDIHDPNTQNTNIQGSFNENEHIIINDSKENIADVVNTPVPISSSTEQVITIEKINDDNTHFASKFDIILSPILMPFYKLGQYCQTLISKISDKINIQSSYKYFLIFLSLGLLLFFFSLFYIPFAIFNPGKLLSVLSFGNIFIMLSFLFYYGSKDFFAFLIDHNRAGVMISHIIFMLCSLFVSLLIGGYFLQLLLDIILCITTVMFVLTLIPGGQGGISGIKAMLISPLMLVFNSFKGKIFGDNSNS